VHVAETAPDACGCGGALRQETDVLDTWFSSGLWPFSTMGWPDETADLARYYPTSLLITAHDIIFFWVARMMMLGLRFKQEVPFRSVYVTSLVRDAHGRKMSKSKGNVVDPLEVMGEIGADAFRFTLAALASPGMDISLSEGRLRAYRQFINKIWNASRFVLMHVPDTLSERPAPPPPETLDVIHRWMLHRVSALAAEIDDALTRYRFDVAADRLYHVFWHEYADWYIELVKPELQAGGAERDRAVAVLLEVHDRLLRMLHPFIPFVTEEVWQALPPRAGEGAAAGRTARTVTLSAFPLPVAAWADDAAVATMALLQDVVTAVRTVRSEWGVPPAQRIDVLAHGVDAATVGTLRRHLGHVMRLAGLSRFEVADEAPRTDPDTVRRVVRGFELYVPLAGIVDRTQEADRVARELARLTKQRGGLQGRLANPAFLERADPDVVRDTRDQEAEVGRRQEKLERILAELGS
jgi:valyl-tRNA synthetase